MLSIKQQKLMLDGARYTLRTAHGVLRGKRIAFDQDHRGFGAVIVFPNGTRSFWGVDQRTMKLQELGIPPTPRPKAVQGVQARWRP